VFWIFALGWLIQVSTGIIGRLLVSGLVLITLHGYFPDNSVRDLAVQAGLLLLIWLPSLPAPRLLAPLLSRLASASLWIYLTHWVVWPPLLDAGVPRAVVVLACLIAGVAANIGVNRLEQAITRLARAGHSRADHSRVRHSRADHSKGAPPKPVSLPSGSR
jgi:hypothetical protein